VAGEEQAFRALTLLVAVCEQAILALASLEPPADGVLSAAAERLRDLAAEELRAGRLTHGNPAASETPLPTPRGRDGTG
jgi:hypothetical protein